MADLESSPHGALEVQAEEALLSLHDVQARPLRVGNDVGTARARLAPRRAASARRVEATASVQRRPDGARQRLARRAAGGAAQRRTSPSCCLPLLSAGAVDLQHAPGRLALVEAAGDGHAALCEALAAAGAPLDVQDAAGNTAARGAERAARGAALSASSSRCLLRLRPLIASSRPP